MKKDYEDNVTLWVSVVVILMTIFTLICIILCIKIGLLPIDFPLYPIIIVTGTCHTYIECKEEVLREKLENNTHYNLPE